MRQIQQTDNEHRWPRCAIDSVKTRKRDLVIRIANWSRDKSEPAFDVEVYIGGVYDYHESYTATKYEHGTLKKAKAAAIKFAQDKIAVLL